jgi:hypothetical protein
VGQPARALPPLSIAAPFAGCSSKISPNAHGGRLVAQAVIAIRPHEPGEAFIALQHVTAAGSASSTTEHTSRGQHTAAADSASACVLTMCDGASITSRPLRAPGGLRVTAALWLPGGEVCIGTAAGTCHLFSPSRPSDSRGRAAFTIPKDPALDLHQYHDAVTALCVLGGADADAAPAAAAAPLCLLVATRCALLAVTGAGTARRVLRDRNSAGALAEALVRESDRGALHMPGMGYDRPLCAAHAVLSRGSLVHTAG